MTRAKVNRDTCVHLVWSVWTITRFDITCIQHVCFPIGMNGMTEISLEVIKGQHVKGFFFCVGLGSLLIVGRNSLGL